ncbi:MAG TPA: hypothetical protein VGL30_05420 [Phenylobacterium sp.]
MLGNQRRLAAGVVATALIACSTTMAAEPDSSLWRNVDAWQVRTDSTLDNGCFMATTYDEGTFLRIGIDARQPRNAYLMIGNPAWKSLEEGKDYKLIIQLDDETPWDAPAQVVTFSRGSRFLYVIFDEKGFIEELMRKQAMIVKYNETQVATLSMKSTVAAIKEVANCQQYADSRRDPFKATAPSKVDPLASPTVLKSDPFAH